MQDKTIDNALLALRKQIILCGLEGRHHVEALCRMRGLALPRVLHQPAMRGEMAGLILLALGEGGMTRKELVAYVVAKRPDIPPERAYWRTDAALSKLRAKGVVGRDGRLWGLAGQK